MSSFLRNSHLKEALFLLRAISHERGTQIASAILRRSFRRCVFSIPMQHQTGAIKGSVSERVRERERETERGREGERKGGRGKQREGERERGREGEGWMRKET